MNSFSSRLKEALEYRGMKAIELSNKTGIGKSSISDWMSGKYEAKQDKVFLLAKVLRVDEAWLMGLDVPMIPRDDILSIYNKLEEPRQEKVYNYAEEQLREQETEKNVSIDKKNFAFETIAAHATEDGKMASEEEIISYAQKIIDAHKKKMEKNN